MPRLPVVGGDKDQWGDILNEYLSVEHNSDGTQKTLDVSKGGTGATTASNARSNLGAAASGTNSDITELTGLTTPLSVAQGGTGATTAAGARTNLGAASQADLDAVTDEPFVTMSAASDLSNETVLGTGVIMSDTLANRPAASVNGRLYFASDNGQMYRDNGSAWQAIGGGVELGYTGVSGTNVQLGANASFADVTGYSVSATVADRPIMIIVEGCYFQSSAIGASDWRLMEDGVTPRTLTTVTGPLSTLIRLHMERRFTPAAGSHTWQLQARTSAGTINFDSTDTGAQAATRGPNFIRVIQL